MPTSYAHYKFGRRVVDALPDEYKYFAYEYPEYFYPALHGPDTAFYLLWNAKITDLGNELHQLSGKEYFKAVGENILGEVEGTKPSWSLHAKEVPGQVVLQLIEVFQNTMRKGIEPQSVILGKRRDETFGKWTTRSAEQKIAYLLGFLCHYALDRVGHQFINSYTNNDMAMHFKVEAEFDRLLMSMDGYNPLTHKVTDHIHPSMQLAETAKAFFPGATTLEMFEALLMQKYFLNLFASKGRLPRKFYRAVTKTIGMKNHAELYMAPDPAPDCYASNEMLLDIFEQAVPEAVEFICTFMDTISGKRDWDERYNWNFDGELVE